MTVLVYLLSGEIRRVESAREINAEEYAPLTIRGYDGEWNEVTFREQDVAKLEVIFC